MSGLISFIKNAPAGSCWWTSGRIYQHLVDDVARAYPNDAEMIFEMQRCSSYGLDLDRENKDLALRMINAIRKVAQDAVDGGTPRLPNLSSSDEIHHGHYVEAMSNLLTKIDAALPLMETGGEWKRTDRPPKMSVAAHPGPVATPAAIYHILNSTAVEKDGHSALIVPNGRGCTYYSYADDNRVDVTEYNNVEDALLAARDAGYDQEENWPCSDLQAASAREAAMAFDGTTYIWQTHNCCHMACAALQAAGANLKSFSNHPGLNFKLNKHNAVGYSKLNGM